MKHLLFFALLLCNAGHAQGTFRIFDAQMNDVTSGVLYIADTNAVSMQVNLTVENTDSNSHEVTAGRLVLSQPATASNAITWGSINYPPNADSSAIPEFISSAGTAPFTGDYFPNSNGGLCTINYCFWDSDDMNNYSCVTVTYDNFFPAGMTPPLAPPVFSYYPNPAPHTIGVGWYGWEYSTVNLYSFDGQLIESKDVRGRYECEFSLTGLPAGIYMISCVSESRVHNSCFSH